MRKVLIIALGLASLGVLGVCSAAFATTPDDCRTIFAGCMKACSKDQQCESNCYEGVGFCLKVTHPGKSFFRGAGTAVGAFSAPATTPGAKNVNSGTAATTTANIGKGGVQAINPGTAITTTTNAARLSAPAKPPTSISSGIAGYAPIASKTFDHSAVTHAK